MTESVHGNTDAEQAWTKNNSDITLLCCCCFWLRLAARQNPFYLRARREVTELIYAVGYSIG